MASICIPKPSMDKLKAAFKKGEISLEKLFQMSDSDRHAILDSYLGNEKFASHVNASFEKAMVSKQKTAFKNFVEKTFGEKQRDLRSATIKKIDKLDRLLKESDVDDFLNDLVDERLGFKVTEAEVGNMLELKSDFEAKRMEIEPGVTPKNAPIRYEYGMAKRRFDKYVAELKSTGDGLTLGEHVKHKLLHPKELLHDLNDTAISVLASLDNSLWGRQGIKELFTPLSGGTGRWATNFAKSLKDIAKQLVKKPDEKGIFANQSEAIMDAIHADILSRDNALTGNYQAAKNGYWLDVKGEEYFPSSLPERIPLLGRLFKASEVAFNGGSLRMRADIADALIKSAEKNGVDVFNKIEADAMGKLTGDLTGRGDIGKAAIINKEIKLALFSIRFLKSNIDFLLAPAKYGIEKLRGTEAGMFAKKEAAMRTFQVIGTIAAIMTLANAIKPGSAELDPRSSNFGRIKVNGRTYDITGGMGSLVILAARIATGRYISSTGTESKLYDAKFGGKTAMDVLVDFMAGKAAPLAAAARDVLKGSDYQGRKPTPETIAGNLVTPIGIQTIDSLKDPTSADGLLAILLDMTGFGVRQEKKYKKKK